MGGVQANKAGLLEIADVFVVNKADRDGADAAVRDLVAMLELAPRPAWSPPIVETVATTGAGIDRLWDAIGEHREHLEATGLLHERRRAVHQEVREMVAAHLRRRRVVPRSRVRGLSWRSTAAPSIRVLWRRTWWPPRWNARHESRPRLPPAARRPRRRGDA